MVETLRPDLYIIEEPGRPGIASAPVSTGFMVGVAERGPVDEAPLIGSFSEFVERFGSFYNGNHLAYCARAFFNQRGRRLRVARVVKAGVKAELTVGALNAQVHFEAVAAGVNGNLISVTFVVSGLNTPLSIGVVGNAITVNVATDGAGLAISTADQVITALTASAPASALVSADEGTGDGTSVVAAAPLAYLAGGEGAENALKSFVDIEETNNTIKVQARDPGAFGNGFFVTSKRVKTVTTADLLTAATEATLASVSGLQVGDILHIDDGVTPVIVTVLTIDLSTSKVTFKAVTLGSTITSGATVITNSNHRLRTKLAAALTTGSTKATLVSATNARVGQRVFISDGTTETSVVITMINGDDIFFSAVTLGLTIASGAVAVSQEFQLELREDDDQIEFWDYLSMEDTNKEDYVENKLSGDGNLSLRIEVTDLDSSTVDKTHHIPMPVENSQLASGADGSTPAASDFIGSEVTGQESGLGLGSLYDDISFLAIPGQTSTTVEAAAAQRASDSQIGFAILETPLASDMPDEALDYRNVQLNIDTSYAGLYYPWLKIPDPEIDGQEIQLPPSGHVMGAFAQVALERGPYKAPANVVLLGVSGLTHDTKPSEQDLLNPEGVNVILAEPGRGIRIMGSRTLQSRQDGYHFVPVRTEVNFIKASVRKPLKEYLFEPIDDDLFLKIKATLEVFLTNLWQGGHLVPRNDKTKAFFVKVDRETTTQADIDDGRVNISVGVNPPRPAEKLVLKISLYDGAIDIQEIAV